jgi:hypothetical protein
VCHITGIELTPSYDAGFCNFFYTATFACHWDKRSERVAKLRKVFFFKKNYEIGIYLQQ